MKEWEIKGKEKESKGKELNNKMGGRGEGNGVRKTDEKGLRKIKGRKRKGKYVKAGE